MHLYRNSFQPSDVLAEPYALLSVGVVADEDPGEARRQAACSAMAMLRMFQNEGYSLLSPDEVEAYPATAQERQVLDLYTDRFLNGTAATVAKELEDLAYATAVDEVMLVTMGHSRAAQARTVDLIVDHYELAAAA